MQTLIFRNEKRLTGFARVFWRGNGVVSPPVNHFFLKLVFHVFNVNNWKKIFKRQKLCWYTALFLVSLALSYQYILYAEYIYHIYDITVFYVQKIFGLIKFRIFFLLWFAIRFCVSKKTHHLPSHHHNQIYVLLLIVFISN